MRSVNSQSMKRRYKNIAGLTCYIQLQNDLLIFSTVERNEVP